MGAAAEMSGYEKAEERKVPFSARLPASLAKSLDEIVEIWKAHAERLGDDPTNINVTHVAVSLLKGAVAGEFDLYGGRPKTEDGWEQLRQAIKEGAPSSEAFAKRSKK